MEVRKPQQRKVPRCPGFEEGITSGQPQEMDLSSRERQLRGPQLLLKQPARRRARLNICHCKPADGHQPSKLDSASHFSPFSAPYSPGVWEWGEDEKIKEEATKHREDALPMDEFQSVYSYARLFIFVTELILFGHLSNQMTYSSNQSE